MKILLADDTELIREGLKSMLFQLPNPAICPEIRTACNGAEAQDSPEVLAARKRIHATIKNLLKRMSRLHYLEFWPDSELLLRYFPVRARIYRLYLETRARLEREKNA